MTHEDAGHYAGKRPGTKLNEAIAAKIREKASRERLSCAEAHHIAEELKIAPADVGIAIDLLEVRITKCQLGLFGHGEEKNIPVWPDNMDPAIGSAIRSSLVNGQLPCAVAWEIAKKFNIAKNMVSAACGAMKIRISSCQLGAFV